MTTFALVLAAAPFAVLAYAYLLYPLALWCLAGLFGRRAFSASRPPEWPFITITVPVHNEERNLRATIERILALDYPKAHKHVIVISDASTDRTDEIATEFRDRGVELLRLPVRAGKTAAENAAYTRLRGDIVINVDATARPAKNALKALVAAFADPTVGVASGHDVSIGSEEKGTTSAESGYVGYEMWVRGLETQLGSIVGASGCFYGIRRHLYEHSFPESLSRDFGSVLIAREHGMRSVSVAGARCGVPRSRSLDAEFRRKVRTMHRGLETLWYKRTLLDPFKHGRFTLMLFSHKLCRWLVPLSLPVGALGLIILAAESALAAWTLGAGVALLAASVLALRRADGSSMLRALALPSYLLMANLAGIVAWWEVFRHEQEPIWEPTRRPA